MAKKQLDHESMTGNSKRGFSWWWLLLGCFMILSICSGYACAVWHYCEPKSSGEFGDMFGGLNSFFSGLAFVGIVIAILLQRQDLNNQYEELKLSREALMTQIDELKQSKVLLALENRDRKMQVFKNNKPTIKIVDFPHSYGYDKPGVDAPSWHCFYVKNFGIEVRICRYYIKSNRSKIKDLKMIIRPDANLVRSESFGNYIIFFSQDESVRKHDFSDFEFSIEYFDSSGSNWFIDYSYKQGETPESSELIEKIGGSLDGNFNL